MTAIILDRLRLLGSFGSNKVMAGELSRLVRRAYSDVRLPDAIKDGPSSICYPFDVRAAAVAVRYHRTSARVLWELFSCSATRLEPLYDELVEWVSGDERELFHSGQGLSVSVRSVEAFAAGERQIVGTVKNAIIEGASRRGVELTLRPEKPDLVFDVRMQSGQLVISLDLAGRAMHERGYRHASGLAPLREDTAALLVMLARYDGRKEALVDPMAGSGTIGIEAACMASARYNWCSGRAPLAGRLPLFEEHLKERAKPLFADTEALVLLGDADPSMRALQERNATTAGVEKNVHISVGRFQSWDASDIKRQAAAAGLESGLIISNPPYGERLDAAADLTALYRDLGSWCRQFAGWRAAFIVGNIDFERAFGGRPRIKKPLRNGQLKATFYLYDL